MTLSEAQAFGATLMNDRSFMLMLALAMAMFGWALADCPGVRNIRERAQDSGTPSSAETTAIDPSGRSDERRRRMGPDSRNTDPFLRRGTR